MIIYYIYNNFKSWKMRFNIQILLKFQRWFISILLIFLQPFRIKCCLTIFSTLKHHLTLFQPHFNAEGRSCASWDLLKMFHLRAKQNLCHEMIWDLNVLWYVSRDSLPDMIDGGEVHPQFVLINQKPNVKMYLYLMVTHHLSLLLIHWIIPEIFTELSFSCVVSALFVAELTGCGSIFHVS